jgi:phage terminase large subunit
MEPASSNKVRIKIPPCFKELVEPHRYKSYYGGRGGAKSWAFSRVLSAVATQRKLRVLCTRELQSSIKESVHRLLSDQIEVMGLGHLYTVQRDSIVSSIGSEFIFKGLRFNIQEIKSTEGIDICWVEEAQSVSEESWAILIPTIRKEASEIWLSWNTGEASDPTYKRFVETPPEDCISKMVSYRDNPYFPATLEKERLYLQRVDPMAYDHIWEGNPLAISDACIFKGKFVVDDFVAPHGTRYYYGSDWGFATDPTTLIRSYIHNGDLWIDYEAYGVGVELDEIPELFDSVPASREGKIKADNSRPDTISHVRKKGFDIVPALKWPSGPGKKGSVREGIEFIRKFPVVHIHQRCIHTLQEFKLYSYKVDPRTNEVLPIIIDKHNHCIDAIRYAYDRNIKGGTDWTSFIGED